MINEKQQSELTWESFCDMARAKSESLDSLRWTLGDLGNVVIEEWGDKTIDQFAREIGQRRSTCYQYSKVSKFYDVDTRERLREEMPSLSYSHLREGLRLADTCTPEVIAWLETVADNSWTVDQAARELTLRLGRETRDSVQGLITGIQSHGDQFVMLVVVGEADLKTIDHWEGHVIIRAK